MWRLALENQGDQNKGQQTHVFALPEAPTVIRSGGGYPCWRRRQDSNLHWCRVSEWSLSICRLRARASRGRHIFSGILALSARHKYCRGLRFRSARYPQMASTNSLVLPKLPGRIRSRLRSRKNRSTQLSHRSAGEREVEVKAGMSGQPSHHLGVFVGGVVVQNQVPINRGRR